MRILRFLALIPLLLIALLVLFSCQSAEEAARSTPLLAAETFDWSTQALSFQPPPEQWYRDRYNQGGLLGVDFIHRGSVGERIYVAEYYQVGQRSRRQEPNLYYALDDVVAQTRFSTEGWPLPADSFVVKAMQPDTVAGVPAYRLDFTMNTPERSLIGREYYFLKNNSLFEAAYLGLPENLPLFERVVASITFPLAEAP